MVHTYQIKVKGKNFQKNFGLISAVILASFSLVFPFLLPSMYIGIDQTVSSVRFPNSFIEKEFNSTDPWIEVSFLVKNFNRFDLDFELTTSIYAQYYPEHSLNMKESTIFRSTSTFQGISYDETCPKVLNFSSSYFDLPTLAAFHTSANLSMPYTFFIDAQLHGSYLANLMSFTIRFTALNISEYEFIL
jgi:hypothetical protein